MIEGFRQALEQLLQSPDYSFQKLKVAVAVSGGSDSMAMVLLAKEAGLDITALTIDHRLRPESADETRQVAQWMQEQHINHHMLVWEHPEIVCGNMQRLAREARYDLLTGYCQKHGLNYLLTGHTEDDQAETVALRQERSAGAIGLAGISARSRWNETIILRPLLAFTRIQLRHYLQGLGQPWIDDPSNEQERFDRIRIRNMLKKDPETRRKLLALGQEMAVRRKQIEAEFSAFAARQIEVSEQLCMDKERWKQLLPELAIYTLTRLLLAVSGRRYPPRYRELLSLFQRIQNEEKGKTTLGLCLIEWSKGKIKISPERKLEVAEAKSHIYKGGSALRLAKPLVSEPFCSIQKDPLRIEAL